MVRAPAQGPRTAARVALSSEILETLEGGNQSKQPDLVVHVMLLPVQRRDVHSPPNRNPRFAHGKAANPRRKYH